MEVQRKLTVGRAANALLETKPLRRMAPRVVVARRLHAKAGYCFAHCAPLYAGLLERSAQDVLRGGPCWAVLRGREQDPKGSAMALRFMGSIHRLVLEGRSPALAHFYPSVRSVGVHVGPYSGAGNKIPRVRPWPSDSWGRYIASSSRVVVPRSLISTRRSEEREGPRTTGGARSPRPSKSILPSCGSSSAVRSRRTRLDGVPHCSGRSCSRPNERDVPCDCWRWAPAQV